MCSEAVAATAHNIALRYFSHNLLLSEVETTPDVEELLCVGSVIEVHQEWQILSTAVGAGRSLEIVQLVSQPSSRLSGFGLLLVFVGVFSNVVLVALDTHRLRSAGRAPIELNV